MDRTRIPDKGCRSDHSSVQPLNPYKRKWSAPKRTIDLRLDENLATWREEGEDWAEGANLDQVPEKGALVEIGVTAEIRNLKHGKELVSLVKRECEQRHENSNSLPQTSLPPVVSGTSCNRVLVRLLFIE
jgi:hypothetical protein